MKLYSKLMRFVVVILASQHFTKSLVSSSRPDFKIEGEMKKEFDQSCLVGSFELRSQQTIADCLEHCLENCLCQSFQICQKTKCQLCSSNKEDNSSLLHENNGCTYFFYKRQHSIALQTTNDQCDSSCSMWYNCCKQPGLCLNEGICVPHSLKRSRKRFRCKCPRNFHGDRCEHPIKSCDDVLPENRVSGVFKILESNLTSYEVYCNFDLEMGRTWTLVQSYSYGNGTKLPEGNKFIQIYPPLYTNSPLSENKMAWHGYRLSKPRMKTIKEKSDYLMFTCNYEQHNDLYGSDHVEVRLQDLIYDVMDGDYGLARVLIERGRVGEQLFANCHTWLYQDNEKSLHVKMYFDHNGCNEFTTPLSIDTGCLWFSYFGNYYFGQKCLDRTHQCLENPHSTTQLWFGH